MSNVIKLISLVPASLWAKALLLAAEALVKSTKTDKDDKFLEEIKKLLK